MEIETRRLRSRRWRNIKGRPVYIISVKLTESEQEQCSDGDLAFEIPEFKSWLFYPVKPNSRFKSYSPRISRGGRIHPFVGVVRGGKWRFLFYSNGIKESKNKVSRDEVKEAVEGSIRSALKVRDQSK